MRPPNSPANSSGWLVRTVPNKFPVLSFDGSLQKEGHGIYDQMTGIGAHEVLIESPDHDKTLAELTKEEVRSVISQYQSRFRQLSKDSRFKYVVIFKNFGPSAGYFGILAGHQNCLDCRLGAIFLCHRNDFDCCQ